MTRINNTPLLLTVALVFSGCAHVPESRDTDTGTDKLPDYTHITNPHFARIQAVSEKVDKDRFAILGMQGEYHVDFDFRETVPLAPGYTRRDDKNAGGFETVIVVENSAEKIVLQHLLVTPSGYVIKHWRQDWQYEAPERLEFVADQTWSRVTLSDDQTKGAWTQCVYEVSDAPRYCGTGRWRHKYGVSTWTSDRTWRPLPRREYTKRNDYNAINAENRHTITSHGWTHEQDNTKTQRNGEITEHTLVREFGFNDYRYIDGFDFSPAEAYWQKTAGYWSLVRDEWHHRINSGDRLRLLTNVDGMPIIQATFEQAGQAEQLSREQQQQAIRTTLDQWTQQEIAVSAR